jgi:hypothetical protein
MKKAGTILIKLFSWAAIAGNIIFMLWISYNGINEHFRGTIYQKVSYIGLMGLLAVNLVLILRGRRQKSD